MLVPLPKLLLPLAHRAFSLQRSPSELWELYRKAKEICDNEPLPPRVNTSRVFATHSLDLGKFDIYGFDYDYTLACYTNAMHKLIYRLGKELLIHTFKYPKEMENLQYRPDYAVRGLHYDVQKGLFVKMDSYRQIQLGSVYRGNKQLSDDEVMSVYSQLNVPIDWMEGAAGSFKGARMQQLNDLFSLPEMGLLANVTEYFEQMNIPYYPEILFWDVKTAVQRCHPTMHKIVEDEIPTYLLENKDLMVFFDRLRKGNKKLFLVTNSPYSFVNKGMTFLIGKDWEDLFDLIVVQARKPKFFSDSSRPFRLYSRKYEAQTWERVTHLTKGEIYQEGCLASLQAMTGWFGQKVLYFGDHVYSDLADLSLHHGWGTGAILTELNREINILNSDEFQSTVRWLERLQYLLEDVQDQQSAEGQAVIDEWEKELDGLRQITKALFNPRFGSLFRTHHNPTFFSHRLFRFADIYMSSITNLLHYPLTHTFYARRGVLPHESLPQYL